MGAPWPPQPPGMTMGQTLDRVYRLIRAHLRLYLGISLVPAGAVLVALAVMGGAAALVVLPHIQGRAAPTDFWFLLELVPAAIFLYCGVFVVYALYASAISHAVVKTHRGETVTAGEAWGVAQKHAGRHIWLMFLLVLILAGPIYILLGIVASLVLTVALAGGHSDPAAGLAFMAFMPLFSLFNMGAQVYMVLMFLRYGLAIPACVMEDLPAVAALQRSVALTRGGKGRFFVVMLAVYAASFVLIIACEIVVFLVVGVGIFAGVLVGASLHSPMLLFVLAPLGILVVLVVMLAFLSLPYVGYSTAIGVFYCDQRMRLENVAANPVAGGVA